jgi:hypothetical protein
MMSDNRLGCRSFETALSGQFEGVGTERIVRELRFKLNADYEATLEAEYKSNQRSQEPQMPWIEG